MRSVLVGNYGVSNLGDEALREYFLKMFPEVSWTVVSARPTSKGEVPRLPFGIRSFFRPWWRTIGAIAKSDALVFGGGSLFTDVESLQAPVMWWMYSAVARMFGVPVHCAFQGVGPFRTSFGSRVSRSVFQHAASISVRDESSFSRLRDWNIRASSVLAFDPAFAEFSSVQRQPSGRRLVLIPRSNSSEAFLTAARKMMGGEWDDVVVLLMQANANDRQHAERLKRMAKHISVKVVEPVSTQEFLDEVSRASFILTQRFHGGLAALAMEIPCEALPQHAGDKLTALGSFPVREVLLRRVEEGRSTLAAALQVMHQKCVG